MNKNMCHAGSRVDDLLHVFHAKAASKTTTNAQANVTGVLIEEVYVFATDTPAKIAQGRTKHAPITATANNLALAGPGFRAAPDGGRSASASQARPGASAEALDNGCVAL